MLGSYAGTYYGHGRGYFGWNGYALGPQIIELIMEAVQAAEAAARFLRLGRLPGEVVAAGEATIHPRLLSRFGVEDVHAVEAWLSSRLLTRIKSNVLNVVEAIERHVVRAVLVAMITEELLLAEGIDWLKPFFKALVHGGVRLGAAISAMMRFNRRR